MLAAALALSSCASVSGPPPNIEDACAIFRDRPDWADAVADSAQRWGAPADVQLAIIWQESKFEDDARPPKRYVLGILPWGRISSAHGYSQALDGTWDWYRRDANNRGADRTDFRDATDFVGWYMRRSNVSNGVGMHDAYSQYLNYHEGHTGFRRGDWKTKSWLISAARRVERKAALYRKQLVGCGWGTMA